MTPAEFAALAATIAVVALTPGPAVTAIVARAIADGARPALALNAGVLTVDLLFLVLAAAGMAAAARSMSGAFTVLRWLGAIYLCWQAIVLWRAKPLVALLVVVLIGGINASYALLAARACHFFANERAQRTLHRAAAVLMLVAAVLVVTRV